MFMSSGKTARHTLPIHWPKLLHNPATDYTVNHEVTDGAHSIHVPVKKFLPLAVPLGATDVILCSVTSIKGDHCVLVLYSPFRH